MRIWTAQSVDETYGQFRSRNGQLTTVDHSLYPMQTHVLAPSDGRGLAPGSEVNHDSPRITYTRRQTIVGIPGQRAAELQPGVRATAGERATNERLMRVPDGTAQTLVYQQRDLRGLFTQYGSYGEARTTYGRG